MNEYEESKQVLEDYVKECVNQLEKGESVRITGGYQAYNRKDSILQRHYQLIVQKLSELGYKYTTNHGYGCYDYIFLKPIEL